MKTEILNQKQDTRLTPGSLMAVAAAGNALVIPANTRYVWIQFRNDTRYRVDGGTDFSSIYFDGEFKNHIILSVQDAAGFRFQTGNVCYACLSFGV
jgi:hypothetical protein